MTTKPLSSVATSDLAGITRGKAFPSVATDTRIKRGVG